MCYLHDMIDVTTPCSSSICNVARMTVQFLEAMWFCKQGLDSLIRMWLSYCVRAAGHERARGGCGSCSAV